jgi:hypothetical protein
VGPNLNVALTMCKFLIGHRDHRLVESGGVTGHA